jgi:hypothetical protein
MKRTFKLFSIILLIIFSACDIIEGPYHKDISNGGDDNGEVVYKVLLEKFTGHRCTFCPAGNDEAQNLKNTYGNSFVVISYHWGVQAMPIGDFTADYRTPEGNEIAGSFGVSILPKGMLNRGELLDPGEWNPTMITLIDNEPRVGLSITHTFNTTDRSLSVSVTTNVIENTSALNVSIFITEDKIISPQVTPDGVIEDYEHNAVFRTSLNGAWGTPIFEGGASAGESENVTHSGTISNDWNENNINIVVFVHDDEDTREVVQVESVKLI